MRFDELTVVLLVLREDARQLGEQEANELQDAHMAHLADLHEAGHLLVAGPLADERLRGLCLLNLDAERARELAESDPAVRAGRLTVEVVPWLIPAGAMSFAPTRFPRSLAEAAG